MAALTASFPRESKGSKFLLKDKLAAVKIFAGALVARNASGYLTNASDAANLKVRGVMKEEVDNSGGSAGDLSGELETGVFKFANSGTNALTIANLEGVCYVEDNDTVSSSGGTNSIKAGKVVAIDEDGGVWVDTNAANLI